MGAECPVSWEYIVQAAPEDLIRGIVNGRYATGLRGCRYGIPRIFVPRLPWVMRPFLEVAVCIGFPPFQGVEVPALPVYNLRIVLGRC